MRKPIPKTVRKDVYNKYAGHCAYCGKEIKLSDMQVDHFISVEHGGSNDLENLMPSCRSCNFYKSAMTVEEFRANLGLLRSRLQKVFIYRMSLAFGLIQEVSEPILFYFEQNEKTKIEDLLKKRCQAGKDACGYEGEVMEWLGVRHLDESEDAYANLGRDGCMLTTEPDSYYEGTKKIVDEYFRRTKGGNKE